MEVWSPKPRNTKKNSYPGVKLTLVEHEPGVAVLLLVNLV